ncbi:MAG: hypothetical protein LUF32_03275 [Clostridiales bacterium]|nr:hypothetical protein [Clostridiales bacterium]
MMNGKKLSKLLVLVFASCLVVSQAGCRKSPVLVQVVYEQDYEVDEDTETESIDNDEEYEDQDEDLSPQEEIDDSDSKRDQTRENAISGDGSDEADQTYSATYSDTAQDTGTAAQGTSSGDSSDGTDSGSGTAGDSTGSGEDNDGTGGGDGSLEGESESGTEVVPGTDEDATRTIVDARGEYVEIPENVDTVTAVGEAAVIVEMLGGSGRLLGSSGSFTGNSMAAGAFSSQGFSDVQTWWDGDGSSTITSASFNALVAAHPDVCFVISGQDTFSDDQAAALAEAGIAYVALYAFTSISNLEKSVSLVGEVLGDRSSNGGTNAPQIAENYASWADGVVSAVDGRGSAMTTLYVSAWDESALWEMKNSVSGTLRSDYGVAIAMKAKNTAPLNDCMGIANLTNRALDNYYIVPLKNNYWLHYVTGGSGKTGTSSGQMQTVLTESTAGVGLGDSTFPAIVVADSSIKSKIENDYHWSVYGRNTDSAGNSAVGFSDGLGHTVPSSIVGDYDIYVNPSGGVASWTEGIEAPLEAAWLSYKFQGGCTLSQLRSWVSEFYSTFYGISVDTASILGE